MQLINQEETIRGYPMCTRVGNSRDCSKDNNQELLLENAGVWNTGSSGSYYSINSTV